MKKTISKDDLMEIGFLPYQSREIIRQAKFYMVKQGYLYYENKRLGIVPSHAVESIIGVSFEDNGEIANG